MTDPPRLLAITPGDGRDLRPWIRALGTAGLPGILLREPDLATDTLRDLLVLAEGLVPWVGVHDRHPDARRLGRPLHLRAGAAAPTTGSWSQSCHDRTTVDVALAEGASFVLWSPVWPPTSKPGDRRSTLGPDAFLAGAAGRPVLALGGIDPSRYRALTRRGATGAAVLGDLFGQRDPEAATRRLAQYLR